MGRTTAREVVVKRTAIVTFWWFMIVSQHPGGTLTAATQGPFGTTGLRGGQGVGWGLTTCWNDGRSE